MFEIDGIKCIDEETADLLMKILLLAYGKGAIAADLAKEGVSLDVTFDKAMAFAGEVFKSFCEIEGIEAIAQTDNTISKELLS